ncbi:recombinase family protein [Candidatus Poriferisodalis sp.]|uniref:recombinase family protein n=1 Tax=Candidatus Poriferisodalis sp. TaxID=3101277 RepID=UPI003B5256EB
MTERTCVSPYLRVISYARVSTGAQAQSGLGIDAQHQAVDREAAARGWQVIDRITDDAVSGTTPTERRPRLRAALEKLGHGDADMLATARGDRLARSTIELLRLYERAEAEGWTLVSLDAPGGLGGPESRLFVGVRAVIAEFEAGMTRARTTEALDAARRRGQRLGRPSRHAETTKALATQLRSAGHSLNQIAVALTTAGVLTPTGNTAWSRSSVASLLRTIDLDDQARANAQAHRQARQQRDNSTELPQQHATGEPPQNAA